MFMAAPTDWLHEMAKGEIKTAWGEMLKAEDPMAEADKVFYRLRKRVGNKVAVAFVTVAPLLAERLAIAEYSMKNPMINEPEVLSYQEALGIACAENPSLTTEELDKLLRLLKTDPTMKPLRKEKQN